MLSVNAADAAGVAETAPVPVARRTRREIAIGVVLAIVAVLIVVALVAAFTSLGADPMTGT